MYSYIIGRITERGDCIIALENNGIGYEINLSSKAMQFFDGVDGEVKVYTYYQQKEDGVSLFGFYSSEEKDMFLKLITVSGVGPKGAITILSNISVSDLAIVIGTQDLNTLSAVKGIGKKTAERIIVELKNKVSVIDLPLLQTGEAPKMSSREIDDAVEVLVSLGLNKVEALRLAEGVYSSGDSAEEIITKALSSR